MKGWLQIGICALLFWASAVQGEKEHVLQPGERFSFYRIYFTFRAPLQMIYEIRRYGNSRLLLARDPAGNRLMVVARTLRLTAPEAQGEQLIPPGCGKMPDFQRPAGRMRCEDVRNGVPLLRSIHWESGAGLLHVLVATAQKEDELLLDQLENSLQLQEGFHYPDDGL